MEPEKTKVQKVRKLKKPKKRKIVHIRMKNRFAPQDIDNNYQSVRSYTLLKGFEHILPFTFDADQQMLICVKFYISQIFQMANQSRCDLEHFNMEYQNFVLQLFYSLRVGDQELYDQMISQLSSLEIRGPKQTNLYSELQSDGAYVLQIYKDNNGFLQHDTETNARINRYMDLMNRYTNALRRNQIKRSFNYSTSYQQTIEQQIREVKAFISNPPINHQNFPCIKILCEPSQVWPDKTQFIEQITFQTTRKLKFIKFQKDQSEIHTWLMYLLEYQHYFISILSRICSMLATVDAEEKPYFRDFQQTTVNIFAATELLIIVPSMFMRTIGQIEEIISSKHIHLSNTQLIHFLEIIYKSQFAVKLANTTIKLALKYSIDMMIGMPQANPPVSRVLLGLQDQFYIINKINSTMLQKFNIALQYISNNHEKDVEMIQNNVLHRQYVESFFNTLNRVKGNQTRDESNKNKLINILNTVQNKAKQNLRFYTQYLPMFCIPSENDQGNYESSILDELLQFEGMLRGVKIIQMRLAQIIRAPKGFFQCSVIWSKYMNWRQSQSEGYEYPLGLEEMTTINLSKQIDFEEMRKYVRLNGKDTLGMMSNFVRQFKDPLSVYSRLTDYFFNVISTNSFDRYYDYEKDQIWSIDKNTLDNYERLIEQRQGEMNEVFQDIIDGQFLQIQEAKSIIAMYDEKTVMNKFFQILLGKKKTLNLNEEQFVAIITDKMKEKIPQNAYLLSRHFIAQNDQIKKIYVKFLNHITLDLKNQIQAGKVSDEQLDAIVSNLELFTRGSFSSSIGKSEEYPLNAAEFDKITQINQYKFLQYYKHMELMNAETRNISNSVITKQMSRLKLKYTQFLLLLDKNLQTQALMNIDENHLKQLTTILRGFYTNPQIAVGLMTKINQIQNQMKKFHGVAPEVFLQHIITQNQDLKRKTQQVMALQSSSTQNGLYYEQILKNLGQICQINSMFGNAEFFSSLQNYVANLTQIRQQHISIENNINLLLEDMQKSQNQITTYLEQNQTVDPQSMKNIYRQYIQKKNQILESFPGMNMISNFQDRYFTNVTALMINNAARIGLSKITLNIDQQTTMHYFSQLKKLFTSVPVFTQDYNSFIQNYMIKTGDYFGLLEFVQNVYLQCVFQKVSDDIMIYLAILKENWRIFNDLNLVKQRDAAFKEVEVLVSTRNLVISSDVQDVTRLILLNKEVRKVVFDLVNKLAGTIVQIQNTGGTEEIGNPVLDNFIVQDMIDEIHRSALECMQNPVKLGEFSQRNIMIQQKQQQLQRVNQQLQAINNDPQVLDLNIKLQQAEKLKNQNQNLRQELGQLMKEFQSIKDKMKQYSQISAEATEKVVTKRSVKKVKEEKGEEKKKKQQLLYLHQFQKVTYEFISRINNRLQNWVDYSNFDNVKFQQQLFKIDQYIDQQQQKIDQNIESIHTQQQLIKQQRMSLKNQMLTRTAELQKRSEQIKKFFEWGFKGAWTNSAMQQVKQLLQDDEFKGCILEQYLLSSRTLQTQARQLLEKKGKLVENYKSLSQMKATAEQYYKMMQNYDFKAGKIPDNRRHYDFDLNVKILEACNNFRKCIETAQIGMNKNFEQMNSQIGSIKQQFIQAFLQAEPSLQENAKGFELIFQSFLEMIQIVDQFQKNEFSSCQIKFKTQFINAHRYP